jgi:transcriptional regulator with PAS, ATPase and Fis domain
MQAKLLRALQEGEIRKVGGQKAIKVDVRVIAATNRDLPSLIKEGKFREDLFYRLNVVSLELPPLRERVSDLPALCARLLSEMKREDGKPFRLSADALALLSRHNWPGNIRELRATLHNAALFSESDLLTSRDFAPKLDAPGRSIVAIEPSGSLQAAQDETLLRVLAQTKGNKSEAARLLGIDRKTLYNRLSKLPKGADS